MSHLLELRDRLLRMVGVIFVVFLCLFPFANDIYLYVAEPLMAHMPEGTSMIATGVATPFLTPFKLSLMAAVFLSMPFILYQFWAFVAPGLYKHEQRLVIPLLISSSFLFYLGMAFAYYVVFPLVFAFFIGTTPDGVAVMTDIAQYLDFVLTLFFAFGIAFEVPIATILLVWMGMTTPQAMAQKRPFVIVGAFVAGMLLTPPDVISQTLLAIPVWILFEAGVQFSKFFVRKDEYADDETDAVDDAGAPAPDPDGGAPAAGRPAPAPASEPEPYVVGQDIAAGEIEDSERYRPMTDEEIEAELEHDDDDVDDGDEDDDADEYERIDAKLLRVQELRDAENETAARALLYQVLAEGNDEQRKVARNILAQMDTP